MTMDADRAPDSMTTPKPPVLQTTMGDAVPRLLKYLKDLGKTSIADLAHDEGNRLSPYFTALENRLSVVIRPFDGDVITYYQTPVEMPEPPVQKGGLKNLFNQVATDTNNVVLSEFSILPEDAMLHPDISSLKKHGQLDSYAQAAYFDDSVFTMGFMQARQERNGPSVSIPVLFLPTEIAAGLKDVDATPMLSHLRDLLTAGNHDMMHHFTNTYLNGSVSGIHNPPAYANPLNNFLRHNTEDGDNNPKGYEGWALTSHILTWRGLERRGMGDSLCETVTAFYDSLTQMDKDLKAAGKSPNVCSMLNHYFSMLGSFILMRFQPLNSPSSEIAAARAAQLEGTPFDAIVKFVGYKGRCDTVANDMALRGKLLDALYQIAQSPDALVSLQGKNLINTLQVYNRQAEWQGGSGIEMQELESFNTARPNKPLDSSQLCDTLQNALHTIAATSPDSFENIPVPEQHPASQGASLNEDDVTARADIAAAAAMMGKHLASITLHYLCQNPAEHEQQRELITECCLHEVNRLQHQTDRANNYWSAGKTAKPSLLIKTLLNYQDEGHVILNTDDLGKTTRTLRLIELAPEIAFLASPARYNQELKDIQTNTRDLDRAVPLILQGKTP
jgi:hypothetical protein